ENALCQALRLAAVLLLSGHVPLGAQQRAAAPADEIPEFALWPADRVKEASDRLEKNIGDNSILFETLGNWKGHSVYLVLRAKTADAEFHKTEEDVYIGLRGKVTFVFGGDTVDPTDMRG